MEKKNSKKWILFLLTGIVVLLLVAILLFKFNHNTYRLIKVDHVEGTVYVNRVTDGVEELIGAFEEMQLINEDRVEVTNDSFLSLLLDEDKHLGAEENTLFVLYADGDENKGKLRIELLSGKALFEIEHKLNEDSTFEVSTPNATLSVRGTVFSVEYDEDNGCTIIEVMDGTVQVDYNAGSTTLEAGENLRINENGAITLGTLPNTGTTATSDSDAGAATTSGTEDLLVTSGEEQIMDVTYQYLSASDPSNSDIQLVMNVQASAYNGADKTGIYNTNPSWTIVESQMNAEAERWGNDYFLPHRDEIDQFFSEHVEEALQIMESGGTPGVTDVTDWFPERMTVSSDEEEFAFEVTRVTLAMNGNYSYAYNSDGELIPAPPNSYLDGDNYVVIGSVKFCIYGTIQ